MSDFKKKYSFDARLAESTKIIEKYSERIPIIVAKDKRSNLENIDKNKFLAPEDLTVAQFISVIRKRIKLSEHEAMYIFINNTLPTTSSSLGTIYQQSKDDDGFLYITYCAENVFGN